MKKNIIINGINSESQILNEELLNLGLDDVVFIDSNKELVNNLNHKSQNLIAYSGNPKSLEFLEFNGINRENSQPIFVSMTDSDSVNDYVVFVRAIDTAGNTSDQFFNVSVKSPFPWRLRVISSKPSIGVGDFIAVLPAARVPVTNTPSPATAEVAKEKFTFAPLAPTSALFG